MRILLSFLFLLSLSASAQVLNTHWSQFQPRNIGPAGMSGRVTAIDALYSNPEIIWVGAASGGVWMTPNGGTTWEPMFDDQPLINIGALKIQQSNPDVIWVGTGEGNPRNSLNLGEGIFKTLDGGKTWKRMGLEKTRNIHRILIDPTDPQTVYVAAIGNPYGIHPERGVYKTTNGGDSWERILYTNDTSGCAELVMDPSNPQKLIANMWQHRRQPWHFNSGGNGSGLYLTVDGGKTWMQLGKESGLPEGPIGRCGIAIAASEPNRIYAKIEATKNGFYRSDDGGYFWQLVNSNPAQVTDRPFYYNEIYVDPKNENRIYDIHSTVTLSEDGGKSFTTLIPYSGIHPDHHAWWIHPQQPHIIIEGNDGGIGISKDRGQSWKFDEQLPFGQFYHVNVDNEQPYHVMGGLQDNGSWRGPAYNWMNGGIRNYFWENIWGGDGFDVVPDPTDSKWLYAMSQGGSLGRHHVETGQKETIRPPAPDTATRLRFNWNAPLAVDPFDPQTIYYGSQFLHRSSNRGTSWEIISPDLTTNQPHQQKEETGGLTLDITGAERYNTIIAIAPSSKNRNVIWIGTDDGNVQLTKDRGKTWTNFRGNIKGMNTGAWITQVHASRYNEAEAFVVVNDYRRGDFSCTVFRTRDFGKTWENIVANKGLRGYALCMLQDPAEPNLIFVGTEHGLWVSLNNGISFTQWTHGFPSVSTYDLAIQEREADLVIATFGRALWVLDDIRPLRLLARNNGRLPSKSLFWFEPPVATQVVYKDPPGYEWSTWGLYEGENRPKGAMLSFFLQPGPVTDTAGGKKSTDSVFVQLLNQQQQIIRTIYVKADTGFNRIYWNFDTKGLRNAGQAKPTPGAPEQGGGFKIFPGTYTAVVRRGTVSDTTRLIVQGDPRQLPSKTIYDAKVNALNRLQMATDQLNTALDRLTDAEESMVKLETILKGVTGPASDSLRRSIDTIRNVIQKIKEPITGRIKEQQGLVHSVERTTVSVMQAAKTEIINKLAAPTAQTERLLQEAELAVQQSVQSIEHFFKTQWKAFREQATATPLNLFKE